MNMSVTNAGSAAGSEPLLAQSLPVVSPRAAAGKALRSVASQLDTAWPGSATPLPALGRLPGSAALLAPGRVVPAASAAARDPQALDALERALPDTASLRSQLAAMDPVQRVAVGNAALLLLEQHRGGQLNAVELSAALELLLDWGPSLQMTPSGSSQQRSSVTATSRVPLPTRETFTGPAQRDQAVLPQGAIATFTGRTRHGELTTEVYDSASMATSKLLANSKLLQQRNPLLYAGLSADELVRTARNSDFILITSQQGTSNLWGHKAPSSLTPQRAVTAITEREFTGGQYGLQRAGRYAELTFVASSEQLRGGGGEVMRQAESWARHRGLDGVVFYNTDTTNGQARGFYEHMGYTMMQETSVDVRSLDARVQQQLVDAGRFTQSQIDRGMAELPRYFFEKRFTP